MATRDHSRSELSEAAIAGIRQLAQDDSDTVLVSCNGQEARFKLPNPPQGSNGEGALVYFKGRWMTPPRFEELCDMKGKVWRRSLRVFTKLKGNEMGWLRMDMWLQRLRQEKQGFNEENGRVQGGAKDKSDSNQEGSGDETSLSNKTGDTPDAENSYHRSGVQAKEAMRNQPAGSRQSQREPQQAAKGGLGAADKPTASNGPSSSGAAAAAAAGVTEKRPKSAPSLKAADEASMGPPRARPARGGPVAQASGARAGAADTTPSSAAAAHSAQMISGRGGKSARGGITTRRGQSRGDGDTPSNNPHSQAESSKSAKRSSVEAETPEAKRQRIEERVKAMAEEEQKAAEAAAAAAAAAAKAREQLADWEAKQAKLAEVERELETAQQRLELKLQEQAEEVERLKQEQARQLEEPTQALKAAEEAVQQAQREADEACQCFFDKQNIRRGSRG